MRLGDGVVEPAETLCRPFKVTALCGQLRDLMNDFVTVTEECTRLFKGMHRSVYKSAPFIVPAEFVPGASLESVIQARPHDEVVSNLDSPFNFAVGTVQVAKRQIDFDHIRVVPHHAAQFVDRSLCIL